MTTLAFGIGGPWDLPILAAVVLLLFGGSKLAGFGKNLGVGIKEFKAATKEGDDDTPSPPAAPASTTTVISAGKTEEK